MPNTPKLNLLELIYDNTKRVRDFFMNEIIGKINSNNVIIDNEFEKMDTAISEKIIQVALKSSLPLSPTLTNNLYIVYGDSDENNGQYRWTGSSYEKISTQLNYATKAEAEAGADNTKVMTPLRVREFFIANGGESGGVTNIVFQSGKKYYKYTAIFATDNFEIPNNLFNPATDVVELIHGGNIPLIKDENYTLVGNLVTFIGYSLDIDDDIHCLITNTAYSYNALSDKPDLSNIVRYSDSEIGTPVIINADTLAGQLPNYYAKQSDLLTLGEQKANKTDALTFEAVFNGSGDLNTANKVNKWYRIDASAGVLNTPPTTLIPDASWSAVYVQGNGAGSFIQTLYSGSHNKILRRRYFNNAYSTWDIIPTYADMEQKADKIWMPNNWRGESSLPSDYVANKITIFKTTVGTWNGIDAVTVTTYMSTDTGMQFISRTEGHPLMYRFKTGGIADTWEKWNSIATTERINISCTANMDFKILENRSYKINNVYYINVKYARIDDSAFVTNNYHIPFKLPFNPVIETPLSYSGYSSSGGPIGLGNATSGKNINNIYVYNTASNVIQGFISGVIIE